MRRRVVHKSTFVCVVAAGSLFAGASLAQDPDVGEVLYQQFCAQCHGDSGHGNGPVAQFLTVHPTDLTGISARNDGEFPMLQVIYAIDGRQQLGPHGGAMPMWGTEFTNYLEDQVGHYASVIEARGRIMSLALYLESIQQ